MCVVRRASQVIFRCFREANRNLYGVKTNHTSTATVTVICLCRPGFPTYSTTGAPLMCQHDVSCLPRPLIYVFGVFIIPKMFETWLFESISHEIIGKTQKKKPKILLKFRYSTFMLFQTGLHFFFL